MWGAYLGYIQFYIEKTYETIFWELQEYLSNLNQKCKLFQIIFFEMTFVTKNWRKKIWVEKIFLDPSPRENRAQKGK